MRETTDTLSIRGRVNPKEHLSRAGLVTRVSRAPVRVREGFFPGVTTSGRWRAPFLPFKKGISP